ncbi:hypothetical protein SODALDRAFT_105233 [Sodiomyces alkalinus F11]|uniref:Uncharacterized protein n=1 Tax=Sodiomyces alkalinus (strain CBS 110278 / VKM F-3762 / F11) TaxID=1314773 RepID=A0A3N2Q2B1_SODAK|nr:hypothetical protein SODALDRAFT_105233 [Sodiomyces alkalinus F11]ROT40808.1 hypothetical protein SODALDRAFT_105233 [Sodiomyces alkalinus F11]
MPPLHGTVKDCTNKVVPALFFLVVVGCITVVLAYSNGIQEPVPRDVTAGLTATLGILVFLFALGRGFLYLQPVPTGQHDLEQGAGRSHQTTAAPLAPQPGRIHCPIQAGGSPSGSSDSNRITVAHPAPGDHLASPSDHVASDSEDTVVPPARTTRPYSQGYENRAAAAFETPIRAPNRPAPVYNAETGFGRGGGGGGGGRADSQSQSHRQQTRRSGDDIGTSEDALAILPSTWGQRHVAVGHPSKQMAKSSLNLPPGRQSLFRNSGLGGLE